MVKRFHALLIIICQYILCHYECFSYLYNHITIEILSYKKNYLIAVDKDNIKK